MICTPRYRSQTHSSESRTGVHIAPGHAEQVESVHVGLQLAWLSDVPLTHIMSSGALAGATQSDVTKHSLEQNATS